MTIDFTDPAAADTLWVVGDRLRFHGGLGGQGPELIEVEVPAGSGTPPHRHAAAEMFLVLEGELTVGDFADGRPPVLRRLGAGGTARVAGWAPHNYANESDRPVRMLVLIEPQMIDFFRDIGTVERQGTPDFERMGAAMARHGIEIAATAA